MKKLFGVALIMGTVYVLILRAISNFITRDVDGYLAALKITDSDSRDSDLQTRKEFLHRQTLDFLVSKVCETSPDSEECYDADEKAYLRQEVAKIEDLLTPDDGNNIVHTFFTEDMVLPDREFMVYDIWYKRSLTDILLYRERQIPYLSSHKAQSQAPVMRAVKGRFADYEDITPLMMSFAIGAGLIALVQLAIPSQDSAPKSASKVEKDK